MGECEYPDRVWQNDIVYDEWKSLHHQPPRAAFPFRIPVWVCLNHLNRDSCCVLEIQPQTDLSAFVKGNRLREFILRLGVNDDLFHC